MAEVRLINANALCQHIQDWKTRCQELHRHSVGMYHMMIYEVLCQVLDVINDTPTIDPESLRPVSEWELNPHRFSCEHFRCKLCHHISCLTDAFCGGCGAKMKNAGTKAEDLPLPIDEYEYKKEETDNVWTEVQL